MNLINLPQEVNTRDPNSLGFDVYSIDQGKTVVDCDVNR